MHRVVIHDTTGDFPCGEVVDGKKAELLVAKRIPSLPLDPQLLHRSALAGYVKREYGRGESYDGISSGRACPVTFYVVPSHQRIHWIAKLVPTVAGLPIKGRLRLANDTTQLGVIKGGLKTAQFAEIDVPAAPACGLMIGGDSRFLAGMEGFLGLCLYGTLNGARVQWLAVSQSHT